MKNQDIIKIIKEEVQKFIKEYEEEEFGEEIPQDWSNFDSFEFHTNAKDAAKADIEASGEEFEDIGKNKFEKGKTEKDFADAVSQANLQLPSDEKEMDDVVKSMKNKEDSEKELKGVADKYGIESPFSLNETRRRQLLSGIINEGYDSDDNLMKLTGSPKENGVVEDPIEAQGVMEEKTEEMEENENLGMGIGLEFNRHHNDDEK